MKRISTVFIVFILFFSLNNAFAQTNDFSFVGVGARAAGMANAFIGVSDDATAISWNPAGLSQLIRPEATIVGRYTTRDEELKYPGETLASSISRFGLNFASLVFPFKGQYNPVIAASFQNQLDLSFKNTDGDFNEESNILVHTAAFAYSMKFGFLHAGVTFNNWFSTGEYNIENAYNPQVGFYNGKEEHSFSGMSFMLGVLMDFESINQSIPMKLGVRFSPGFELEDEIKATVENFGSTEYKTTFEMPSSLGFGLSFRVLDALTLAGDFEMVNVKDKKQKIEDASFNLSASNENMNQFRVGAEYLIITDNVIIPLRAGFKNNPTLYADIESYELNGTPVYSDQVMGNSINFGAGLIFSNVSFDIAYERFNFTVEDKVNEAEDEWKFNFITLSGIFYF